MSTGKILILSQEPQERAQVLAQETAPETYLEMNMQIVEVLRLCGNYVSLYAAQRIEELEQKLKEARAALADAELGADLDCMYD